jgi:hypothetical protein
VEGRRASFRAESCRAIKLIPSMSAAGADGNRLDQPLEPAEHGQLNVQGVSTKFVGKHMHAQIKIIFVIAIMLADPTLLAPVTAQAFQREACRAAAIESMAASTSVISMRRWQSRFAKWRRRKRPTISPTRRITGGH